MSGIDLSPTVTRTAEKDDALTRFEPPAPPAATSGATEGFVAEARAMLSSAVAWFRAADPVSQLAPLAVTAVIFGFLFAQPAYLLVRDWWTLPEAGHGLLLAPVALWLAAKTGIATDARPSVKLGTAILLASILVRYASGLAAELFTMRASMLMALVGLTVYFLGVRQVLRWWLPFVLLALAIPLPELITQSIALPLQFKASQMGAALLRSRDVPVLLTGNVIRIPRNELFVTEACSGLRSLTALLSVAILMGGLVLSMPISRLVLVLVAIPIAIFVNGVRVFLTGFLVYFVDPALGQGFMHITEGWLLFVVSLTFLGLASWLAVRVERLSAQLRGQHV